MFKHIPILYSLRDYIYPEALQGSFLIRKGDVIVNSQFIKDSFLATGGRYYPELKKRTHLIPNGINTDIFFRKNTTKIEKIVKIPKESSPVLLFPHRPGPEKGIYETLNVVEKLVKIHNLKQTKLLIARGIDEAIDPKVSIFYENILNEAKKRNIENNILFHPWIPPQLMPDYYSLGNVTLCLGNIVEAFSNVTLESLACETPVIAAKVSCYRTFLPDWCIKTVNYNDADTTAKIIVDILQKRDILNMKNIRAYVRNNLGMEKMCQRYREIIYSQKVKPSVRFNPKAMELNNNDVYMLPPWCSLSPDGIYNDYLMCYVRNEKLIKFFTKLKRQSFTFKEAFKHDINKEFIRNQMDEGFLIKQNYIV